MHPSIRIATVLAAVTCLAWGGVPAWAATAVALVTVRLAAGVPMAGWWRPLWRLRWLLLALCVVHLWLPASAAIEMPQRLLLAAGNVVALALAALVVDTLLLATPRDELLAGLLWLLGPLSRLGCPVERFAVRLWLTLEAIPLRQRDLETLLAERRPHGGSLALLARLMRDGSCAGAAADTWTCSMPAPPRLYEWLWPSLFPTAVLLARLPV